MSDANQEQFADATTPEAEAIAEAIAAEGDQAQDLDPITALIAERDGLKDRLLRTLAESDNVRKRAERDRREAEKYGGTRIVRDLLPVYDNLRRALNSAADAAGDADRALVEGV